MIIAPGGQAPKRAPEQDLDTIALQLDRWARGSRAQHQWAETARQCQNFFEGNQWTPEEESALRESGRPKLTINRISPLVRIIKGYFRQNRYDVKYLAQGDGVATEQGAEAITAVAKQISEVNGSKWNHAEVFSDGIVAGRGYLDYRLDQTRNVFGEIKEEVLDPFAVYPDPEAETYGTDGWQFCQISRWLSWYEIQQTFGTKVAGLVDTRGGSRAMSFGGVLGAGVDDYEISPDRFFGLYSYLGDNADRYLYSGGIVSGHPMEHIDRLRKLIRVLECQHRVLTPVRQFVDLQTGMTKVIPDGWDDGKIRSVVAFMASRQMPLAVRNAQAHRVRHTITAADVVLYDDWSPYETMTVVPYFAYFRRGKTMGMVEDLLDPQREVNKRRSVFLHIIMTTANSGWKFRKDSISDEVKELLEREGSKPGILIEHEDERGPERLTPAVPPTALDKAEEKATRDLEEVSGINRSAQGNVDRVQSGRAVLARQKQAVIGAEQYFDNFARTRELVGRKILEMVQGFYTEQRIIRTTGDGGDDQETVINRRTGAGVVLNDVTSGTYLVAVDEAPMADTFQDQQFQDLVTMKKDLGLPIPDDVLIESSSVPYKQKIIKRLAEASQSTQPPSKIVESINYKDLPPDGQAQMAAKAGIKIDPAALTAREVAQGAPQPHTPGTPGAPQPPMQGPPPGGPPAP